MSRIAHILKELGRNIYRNPGNALGALLSLILLFILFDLYWIAAATSEQLYTRLISEIRMEVYLAEEVEEEAISGLQNAIGNSEGVLSIDYISKEKARDILHQILGTDLLVGYDSTNPLPRSFALQFQPDFLNSEAMNRFEQAVRSRAGISDIVYSRDWLIKAEQTRWLIRRIGFGLGIFIFLTALISSVSNIRLMSRARAQGFHQMRLLGAGRLFLSFSFLLEGFFIGFLSAGIGWAAITYGRTRISLAQIEIVYPPLEDIIIFCCITAVLGSFAGFLGIRKLLR